MSPFRFAAIVGVVLGCSAFALPVAAQQVTVGTTMNGVSDGFFEGVGVGFGASGKNWFFNNGGGVAPPFGGLDSGAGANFGFGFGFPGGNGFFNVGAAQGSSRGLSSTSASVTTIDGGQGYIAAVTQQPFVIGIVPVVGGTGAPIIGGFGGMGGGQFGVVGPQAIGPSQTALEEKLARIQDGALQYSALPYGAGGNSTAAASKPAQAALQPVNHDVLAANDPTAAKLAAAKQSSAGNPSASIAVIRQQQLDEEEAAAKETESLLDQGRKAQASGKIALARIYYQQANRRATGTLKQQVQEALHSLGDQPNTR